MSKVLTVFGATGQQGGSVINTVLASPILSKEYKLRGLTRNTSSPAAQALQEKGVKVVEADIDNPASLSTALKGSHTVFAVTVTTRVSNMKEIEIKQGKLVADAVVAAGAEYFIFSTLTHALELTGKAVDLFDSKAEVEDYIRTLPIKSAFFAPGSFMQNWHTHSKPRPTSEPGVYVFASTEKPDAIIPFIDILETGKYVKPLLQHPDKYEGKVMSAASGLWTYAQLAEVLSKATGKKVEYNQVPAEVFKNFMPAEVAPHYLAMFDLINDPGYFGPQTAELVKWTVEQMDEKPTSIEDFFIKNPPQLE